MNRTEILREVQNIQLNILKEVAKICEQENIDYFLFYGTLIGSIRHKSFIPWDDDIDIVLTRDNYERLILILEEKLPSNMYIQSKHTDKNIYFNFSKIRYRGTYLQEENIKNKLGDEIFIDIIPIDKVPKDLKKKEKQRKKINRLHKIKTAHLKINFNYKSPTNILKNLIRTILRVIPLSYTVNKLELTAKKYNDIVDSIEVADFSWGINNVYYDSIWFNNVIKHKFVDQQFNVPKHFNKILNKVYGDYMVMPPDEERNPHHLVKVSLDNKVFYENYNGNMVKIVKGREK